jgi:hypothetical protein
LIAPLASSRCKTCANFFETAKALRQRGSRYSGAAGTFELSIVLPESTASTKLVEITYTQNAVDILDRDGRIERTENRQLFVCVVTVGWEESGWRVTEIQVLPR